MPYTMGLLGAVPRSDRERNSRLVPIPGSPMNLVNMPKGCPFAPRCPLATDICHTTEPAMEPVPGRPGQFVACHRTQEIVSKGLTFHDVYTVPRPPSRSSPASRATNARWYSMSSTCARPSR